MEQLTWVLKKPGQPAVVVPFETNDILTSAQQFVGGYVQAVGVGPGVTILVDEDGLGKNLPDNCGFVGNILFVEDVLISEEEGYDWGSLSEENQRKALAWCQRYSRAVHPNKDGGVKIITGDQAIKEHRERQAADARSKRAEWQSL